jgi:hypothetical protein
LLIYGAGLVLVLLSCCGLILDLGSFELTKLKMQNAADAAAMGAVLSQQNGGPLSAGLQDASQNGFTNGSGGVTVTILSQPTSGAYTSSPYAVQAVVTKQVSGLLLRANITLNARATAFGVPTPCVYFLNRSAAQTTLLAVNETFTGTCPLYAGYNYNFNGGSSSSGMQFFVSSASGNSTGAISPNPAFGAPPLFDPLAYIPSPVINSHCDQVNYTVVSAATLTPGVYCGGLTINTSATVTLNAGMYIVLGSLNINGPTLKGPGVTFYVGQGNGYTYGPSMIQNVNSTLSAPTTGTYQGLLFYSDRTIPAGQANLSMQNWNPTSHTDGILYLYNQELLLSNLPLQPYAYFGVVADYISVHNTGFYPAANYSSLAGGNPFHPVNGVAGLVE